MSAMIHPAGKRFLMRKCSNVENLPPSALGAGHAKKAEALVSAREASRRRRARVVSGSVALRKIVHSAQRRASKPSHSRTTLLKLEQAVASLPPLMESQRKPAEATQTAPASSPPVGSTLEFPRWLARPAHFPQPFERANIDACGEGVVGVPHKYILRGLDVTGHNMWRLIQGATFETEPLGHTLPQELKVIIADHTLMAAASQLPSSFPTHVLAVWDAPTSAAGLQNGVDPATGRRKVRLVPVHNLVLAAHCANWFPMPSNPAAERKRVVVNSGGAVGTQLSLPVVPLPVAHVDSFHQLMYGLYTHKVSRLLDELVPVPKPAFTLPTAANPRPQNPHYIVETGKRLAARYQPWAIVRMLRHVIGLWQNVCQLGVSDKRLWLAIDWSWDMLLTGLAYATGQPDSVPRPQPRIFGCSSSSSSSAAAQQQQQQQGDVKTGKIFLEHSLPQYSSHPHTG